VVSIIKEVEEKKATPFKQENIHGSELYYDEELDGSLDAKKGKIYPMILPGVNASVTGVKVSGSKYSADQKLPLPEKKQYSKGEMREQPLPYMDILDENGTPKKSKGQIGKEANKKAASLIKESKPKASDQPELLPMYVFSEDTVSPAGGDDYLLFDVLKGAFINKRWSQAAKDLEQFLMQNRSASVTNRANFYLGECYYFMAQYPKALNQFLLLRDSYPALTRKWSKSALDLYTLPVEE
jgi:TolA-binding protein